MKALLRKAEARTNEALLLAIGDALSQVTQKDVTHWHAHYGSMTYGSSISHASSTGQDLSPEIES